MTLTTAYKYPTYLKKNSSIAKQKMIASIQLSKKIKNIYYIGITMIKPVHDRYLYIPYQE